MSMKQWSLFTSTRGVYLLIIQIYVSVLKNGWVTLGPLSKTAWTVEPSWTAWTSEPHVPHEERSAGRTAPLTGRTILQPKAIRCSWYRVRALVRKCVRRSVCQRAVSARRALTGLSANHVRVKQHHVCPSANFCCVSAGKGSLPWSAFYNASRYIYFTPSQCPLAFKCFCFFPRILSNYVFNGLVYGSFNPYIPIASNYSCSVSILLSANQQNIVAVRGFFHPWLPYRFLPVASNYSSFWSHSIYHCSTHLLSFCQLAPPPSYNCCSWSLSKCSVLSSSIALPWFLSLPHVILRYVLVYLFYVLSQRRSVCSCYHSDRELNGNVCHPTKLTQVRWDDSGIVTGIGHLSSHMVQQIQSQFIL